MPNQETIEKASEEDMEEVLELLKICGLYIPNISEYMLSRGETSVARIDGKIVGTRSFRFTSGEYCHVYGLCVHPEYRRRGIGERLCRDAERKMWKRGAKGYVGEANNEHIAQYYVRALGVRICRLSFRGWREGAVPYRKDFKQGGLGDHLLLGVRRLLISFMRMRLIGRAVEFAARRIEKL